MEQLSVVLCTSNMQSVSSNTSSISLQKSQDLSSSSHWDGQVRLKVLMFCSKLLNDDLDGDNTNSFYLGCSVLLFLWSKHLGMSYNSGYLRKMSDFNISFCHLHRHSGDLSIGLHFPISVLGSLQDKTRALQRWSDQMCQLINIKITKMREG